MLHLMSFVRTHLVLAWFMLPLVLLTGYAFPMAKADDRKDDARNKQTKQNLLDAELQKLRGSWKVKSFLVDGKSVPDSYTQTFSKSGYSLEWAPSHFLKGDPRLDYDFEIDLKADPKVIWQLEPRTSKKDNRSVAQIYRIRGDVLEICSNLLPGHRRTPPMKFDGSTGSRQILVTLERIKPGKSKRP